MEIQPNKLLFLEIHELVLAKLVAVPLLVLGLNVGQVVEIDTLPELIFKRVVVFDRVLHLPCLEGRMPLNLLLSQQNQPGECRGNHQASKHLPSSHLEIYYYNTKSVS